MTSVGEVMAIGRTFEEAIQKAIRMVRRYHYGTTIYACCMLSGVRLDNRLVCGAYR